MVFVEVAKAKILSTLAEIRRATDPAFGMRAADVPADLIRVQI